MEIHRLNITNAQLQVEPLVAHFFVIYYGVLADITTPVALAAYAAAGIAASNPFKTGNTTFRLGIAKATVPLVFVYSSALHPIYTVLLNNHTQAIW